MGEIFKFITESYLTIGLVATLLIVILVGAIAIMFKTMPKFVEKRMDLREKEKERKYHQSSLKRIICSYKTNEKLKELMDVMQCYHAYIFEYHNGGHNASGLNFQHMSLHYMASKLYAQNEVNTTDFSNLSLSFFPALLKDMELNSVVSISVDDERFKDFRLFQKFQELNAKQFIAFPIHGYEDSLGFILLLREEYKELGKDDYIILDRYAQKISTTLDLKQILQNENLG